ncbi:hypothetical protein E2P81_ATG03435 [Venturia nashicola]|nr:hypothetical protein E2P81_ATG03435 [Venturia nashicola]
MNANLDRSPKTILKTLTTIITKFLGNNPHAPVKGNTKPSKGKERCVERETGIPGKRPENHALPTSTVGSWQRRFLPNGRTQDRREQRPLFGDARTVRALHLARKTDDDDDDESRLAGDGGNGISHMGEGEGDCEPSSSIQSAMTTPKLQVPKPASQGSSSRVSSTDTTVPPTAESSSMGSGFSPAKVAKAQSSETGSPKAQTSKAASSSGSG